MGRQVMVMRSMMIFLLAGFLMNAQQTYTVHFKFTLRNGHKQVEYREFCGEFQILNDEDKRDVTPCENKNIRVKDFYKSKTRTFNAGGQVMYEDLVRKFIHGQDTMLLVLQTDLGKILNYEVEDLEVRPGRYSLKDGIGGKIDFDKAEENYYNYILRRFKSLGELTDNYETSYYYKELNRLRDLYLVPLDDYDEKTIDQLRSYRKKLKRKSK